MVVLRAAWVPSSAFAGARLLQRIIEAMHALRGERWSYREISRKLLEEYGVRLSHEGVRRLCSGGRDGGSATRGQGTSSGAGEEVARERHPR